jgi:serine/threonine protein kinase
MVMDLCAATLSDIIYAGKFKYGLPIDIVKEISRQILYGLKVLHNELNIIHTDLKPPNVLIMGDNPKFVEIINMFDASNFKNDLIKLFNKYKSNLKTKKDKDKYKQALKDLAFKTVAKLGLNGSQINPNDEESDDEEEEEDNDDNYYVNEFSDEENNSEDDDNFQDFIDNFKNKNDIKDEEEFDHEEETIVLNTRRQSIDDYNSYADDPNLYDLSEYYNDDDVITRKHITTDKASIIDDKYVLKPHIKITDFGTSYHINDKLHDEIQDRRVRAPEIIMDLNYDYNVDIWSLGCIVFELLTGITLFDTVSDVNCHSDIHQLYLIEHYVGKIPKQMIEKAKRGKYLFDATRNNAIRNTDNIKYFPFKDRLIRQFLFSESEASECAEFLEYVLTINPSKRPNVEECLNHKWLK